MFKKYSAKILLILAFVGFFLSFTSLVKVEAASGFPAGCEGPFGIPSACPTACTNTDQTGCYVPDFSCSNAKFLNPQTNCCNNKCRGGDSVGNIPLPDLETLRQFNIFGTKFYFSPDSIPSLINIAISTFLGFVSIYALVRGMYVGAIVRARATSSDDIAKANKEFLNLIIGFILAWGFIFIIQFVTNFLGIGSLTDFNVTNTGAEIIIT